MPNCDVEGCDRSDQLDFVCSYCKERFCAHHRLPEKHDCVWLQVVNTLGPDFRKLDLDSLRENFEEEENDVIVDVVDDAKRLSQTTKKKEINECNSCQDFTTPDNDLCLKCRRKQSTMTYSSPDVALDGSVKSSEPGLDPEEDKSDASTGILDRILTSLKLK